MSGIEKKKEKMIERAIIITDKNSGMWFRTDEVVRKEKNTAREDRDTQ